MQVQQVAVKLLARGPVEQEPLIAVFHRWIRQALIPDHLLIDVADYRHVPEGPGVMLIAHQAHLALDEGCPGVGLSYGRRRDAFGEAESKVRDALSWAAFCATLLEREGGYSGILSPNDVVISIRSRAVTTDAVAASKELKEVVNALAGPLWAGEVTVTPGQDPRRLTQVRVRASSGFGSVSELAGSVPLAATTT